PVRGHHIPELISTLNQVKKVEKPVLVHVLTKKGKGYEPAEKEPERYHGISSLSLKSFPKKTTYTEVFGKTLTKIGERNKKVVAITAAMPDGTGLRYFKEKFPERFFDVGIAEAHAVTFAAGLATEGMIPICAIYSTFLQRAYDQIVHDVALQKLHVVFCLDRAGLVSEDGPTHHGIFDISYLRHIPNLTIMAPKDGRELVDMIYTAVEYCDGPVAIRYPKDFIPDEFDEEYEPIQVPIGKAEILRGGREILIIGIGSTVQDALKAAETVEKELRVSPIVVNARFVKPLDEKNLMNLIERVNLIVTVEDNVIMGGFGSRILEWLAKNRIKKDVMLLGIEDEFPPHGKREELKKICGIDHENIARRIISYYGNSISR
ncbi:MAG: transketolase C-terminal domain-containing protein, partial [Thermosulfidibacteraceae bacterium]